MGGSCSTRKNVRMEYGDYDYVAVESSLAIPMYGGYNGGLNGGLTGGLNDGLAGGLNGGLVNRNSGYGLASTCPPGINQNTALLGKVKIV